MGFLIDIISLGVLCSMDVVVLGCLGSSGNMIFLWNDKLLHIVLPMLALISLGMGPLLLARLF